MYDESKHTQVKGSAVAVSGGAGAQTTVKWLPEFSNVSFEVVPNDKKLVLTDVLFNPQGDVTAAHWINISDKSPNNTMEGIIQFCVPPNATQQVHFHTGHVIEPGKKVVVFTDANPPSGQHFTVDINGYLAKLKTK